MVASVATANAPGVGGVHPQRSDHRLHRPGVAGFHLVVDGPAEHPQGGAGGELDVRVVGVDFHSGHHGLDAAGDGHLGEEGDHDVQGCWLLKASTRRDKAGYGEVGGSGASGGGLCALWRAAAGPTPSPGLATQPHTPRGRAPAASCRQPGKPRCFACTRSSRRSRARRPPRLRRHGGIGVDGAAGVRADSTKAPDQMGGAACRRRPGRRALSTGHPLETGAARSSGRDRLNVCL